MLDRTPILLAHERQAAFRAEAATARLAASAGEEPAPRRPRPGIATAIRLVLGALRLSTDGR
jgi:hypothetical protein